jgi:transposase
VITLPRTVCVWAFPRPIDLRKSYNGLWGLVKDDLRKDPMSGDLFLFVNQRRKGCKVLLWDGTGPCIFMKKLERGQFAQLWPVTGESLQMTASELSLFVEGCVIVGRHRLSPRAISTQDLAPTDRL